MHLHRLGKGRSSARSSNWSGLCNFVQSYNTKKPLRCPLGYLPSPWIVFQNAKQEHHDPRPRKPPGRAKFGFPPLPPPRVLVKPPLLGAPRLPPRPPLSPKPPLPLKPPLLLPRPPPRPPRIAPLLEPPPARLGFSAPGGGLGFGRNLFDISSLLLFVRRLYFSNGSSLSPPI